MSSASISSNFILHLADAFKFFIRIIFSRITISMTLGLSLGLHSSNHLGHCILPLLHQLHHQPLLLCSLQRHIQVLKWNLTFKFNISATLSARPHSGLTLTLSARLTYYHFQKDLCSDSDVQVGLLQEATSAQVLLAGRQSAKSTSTTESKKWHNSRKNNKTCQVLMTYSKARVWSKYEKSSVTRLEATSAVWSDCFPLLWAPRSN